jgi:hypothetical protein
MFTVATITNTITNIVITIIITTIINLMVTVMAQFTPQFEGLRDVTLTLALLTAEIFRICHKTPPEKNCNKKNSKQERTQGGTVGLQNPPPSKSKFSKTEIL